MRKAFFLLLLLCMGLSSKTVAQTGLHAGVISGFNNTWVVAQEQYDNNRYRYKKAFAFAPFGISAGYKFNPNHGVMVEAFRSNVEGKYELLAENGEVAGEKVIDLKYWSVPVLFKLTTSGEKARFNFQLGPQVSFLSEGEEYNTITKEATFRRPGRSDITLPAGTYLLASTEMDVPDNDVTFNTTDIGIVAAAGAEINFTDNLYLSTNLRFNYNIRNIFKDESVAYPNDIDTYTLRYTGLVGIQVGLHYFFGDQNKTPENPFNPY